MSCEMAPRARAPPCAGAAATIITKATASISAPAAAVRHVLAACSRLTTAVIPVTPFPCRSPASPYPLR